MTVALSGLRIVEIASGIAGPYAAKLLADLGAEVTKIEPPAGDPLRRWGPFPTGVPDHDRSGLFEYLNAGKLGMTSDFASDAPDGRVHDLIAAADVLIEDLSPGLLEGRGLGPDVLRGINPKLVVVRLSNFGQRGPLAHRAATPLTMQAAAGWVSKRGTDRPPFQAGARIPEYAVGAYAALAALTALRCRTGASTDIVEVDLSIFESLVSTLAYPMLAFKKLRELGMMPSGSGGPILGVVEAADGFVGINCLTGQHWLDVCAMVGLPEFGEHQIAVMQGGPERAEFFEQAAKWLRDQRVLDIVDLCQALRIPAAPVNDGASALRCPQYVERSFFLDAGGEDWSFTRPGAAFRLSKTPVPAPRPAPILHGPPLTLAPSQHGESTTVHATSATPTAPFHGLTVLDLSTFWAGAYLTCYLGGYGAEVIKVESIQRPDGFRYSGAFPQEGDDWYERSLMWQATNLSKRDVTINLTTDAGRDLLRRLVSQADVVVENFSPRVVEQFGLDYESLAAMKPDVVMVRMPGFGLEGPWRDYVGWALNFEQTSGMSAATGYPDGPPVDLQGPADPIVGLHAATALLAALEHRRRTGEGQLIEVAQIEAAAAVTAEPMIEYSMTGSVRPREGNRSRDYPQGVYPTASSAWVALSIRDDHDWAYFLTATGQSELSSDPRFASTTERLRAHDAFDAVVSDWTRSRSAREIIEAFEGSGVPLERVMTPDRMYDVEQLNARGYYEEIDHPLTGRERFPGWPFRITPGPERHHRWPAPTLGQDNDEVLRRLGMSRDDLTDLADEQVIGTRALGM